MAAAIFYTPMDACLSFIVEFMYVQVLADRMNEIFCTPLSGGERQWISIARAILKDAPVIVLDESTASMDADNETRLQKALSELIKNKTVLIIAHRLRTIEKADKIIVLDKGQVMESG